MLRGVLVFHKYRMFLFGVLLLFMFSFSVHASVNITLSPSACVNINDTYICALPVQELNMTAMYQNCISDCDWRITNLSSYCSNASLYQSNISSSLSSINSAINSFSIISYATNYSTCLFNASVTNSQLTICSNALSGTSTQLQNCIATSIPQSQYANLSNDYLNCSQQLIAKNDDLRNGAIVGIVIGCGVMYWYLRKRSGRDLDSRGGRVQGAARV